MAAALMNRGFVSLLSTQFLGAANDNILKQILTFMVATGIWSGPLNKGGLGEGGQVAPALLLTIPFIFLSGIAGQVADRRSKRTVMLAVKIAELPIAGLAFLGFYTQNLWITLVAMLLLATQSTFFGPAKYGVIPELVADDQLSRANGLLNMLTNIAVIAGAILAGPISDWYDPKPVAGQVIEPLLWVPGAALMLVAVAGLMAVLFMPRLAAQDPNLRYTLNPFATYIKALREMAGTPLLGVVFAWAFFYMVGMMALLIIPEYESLLNLDYKTTSYLFGVLGIAIGVGSVTAGLISGNRIRIGLVPLGAIGMITGFLLLGLIPLHPAVSRLDGPPPTFYVVAGLILLVGCSAGFYIIPLQSMLQHLAPDAERGRFLGTANALSFCFSSSGAAIYWLTANQFGMSANRIFLVSGGLAFIAGLCVLIWFKRRGRNLFDEAPSDGSRSA